MTDSPNIEILKQLGLSEETIIERVVEKIADQMLYGKIEDLDYNEVESGGATNFRKAVDARINAKIDTAITTVADKHTLPNLTEYLEDFCLQETNSWGEAKGKSYTFTEYLTHRAELWFSEKVDHNGKDKSESGGYSWSPKNTRIAHMIHSHLNYHIRDAMTNAYATVNKSIATGLNEAVRMQLNETLSKIKATIEVK